MAEQSYYVHGTHAEEQQRLTKLNSLLNERSLRELGPARGDRVIDVGAGLGQFARAVAHTTGSVVVGVERSRAQLAEGIRQARAAGEESLVDLREGDAIHLPLTDDEWATFDIAHARFLLEHVPDPLEVVKSMVRAVRPGGRIVLEDDDHELLRLWPEPAGVAEVWKAYMRTYDRAGNDPFMGRRLIQLLHEAGAKPHRNTLIFFGSCAGEADFDRYVDNLATILEGARSDISATGMRGDEVTAAIAALAAWKGRPDSALWYAMSWAEAVRP